MKIGDFFKFHDLVIIILCLFRQRLTEDYDDICVRVIKVENTCNLCIQELLIRFLAIQRFVRNVDLIMFL